VSHNHPKAKNLCTHTKLYNSWEQNFELIRRKGTIVAIGNASGAVPPFAPLKLAPKNLKVVRPVYVERHPIDLKLTAWFRMTFISLQHGQLYDYSAGKHFL